MDKGKQSCSLENLKGVAGELRKLADQIESGKVTVGGVTLSVCNAVSLKIKQKLVSGQVKFDLNLVASLVDESSSLPDKHSRPKITPKNKTKSRPYEVKKMKKTIAQQWKLISSSLTASNIPDTVLWEDFLKTCEEYGQTAEDGWQPLWEESLSGMKHLYELAKKGKFPEALALLSTINNQKKLCHKKYK